MKFYPSDWRADPALRSCSVAARGLWVEMLCIMHEASPYGSLLIAGARIDKKRLASLAGTPEKECTALLLELEGFAVFSRDEDGTIYSRRMRRDAAKSEEGRKQVGKRWGDRSPIRSPNRSPNTETNTEPNTQKPEATSRKKDSEPIGSGAEAPLVDPSQAEREYFSRGREVLGKSAGGQLAKLLKSNGGNVSLSRSTLELAATKHDKSAFFARAISHQSQGPPAGKGGFTSVLMDKHQERQNGTSTNEPEFLEH